MSFGLAPDAQPAVEVGDTVTIPAGHAHAGEEAVVVSIDDTDAYDDIKETR